MRDKTIVYVVDDDDDDRMFTREAFENVGKGIEITEFIKGQQLLEVLYLSENDALPSLILMDINMPGMSGLEVLSNIRSNPVVSHIPVILFSTSSSQDTITSAYHRGCNAYFVKPVSLNGFTYMAQAVALCFLNRGTLPEKITNKKGGVAKAKNILVIEDNSDHWKLMRLAMETMGGVKLIYRNNVERTKSYLVSVYRDNNPQIKLIVLDLYLPSRQQGLYLIDWIRNFFINQNLPPIPIIVFSGSDHKDDIKASYQCKANAYIVKSHDLARSAFYLNDVCNAWANVIATPKPA